VRIPIILFISRSFLTHDLYSLVTVTLLFYLHHTDVNVSIAYRTNNDDSIMTDVLPGLISKSLN